MQLAADTEMDSDISYEGYYFELTNDIDLSDVCGENVGDGGTSWTRIGYYINGGDNRGRRNDFSGTFDGKDYTISGLYISPAADYNGLFGLIGENGVVKNLTVEGTLNPGDTATGWGGIAGNNEGTIENCTFKGTIEGGSQLIGGIAGGNAGKIKDCYFIGNLTTSLRVSNSGEIGGIVGYNYNGTVENCHNNGTVTSIRQYVGGIVGHNTGTVTDCDNNGKVDGANSTGGVVGYNNKGTVQKSNSTAAVTGNNYVGGIVGQNSGTVTNCDNKNATVVTGEQYVGGIAGQNTGSLTNCDNNGSVSGSNGIGGVVGDNGSSGTIEKCNNIGEVTGTVGSIDLGGIAGTNSGLISVCINEKNITGGQNVGGIVGANTGTTEKCYNKGSVNGDSSVGGVVGSGAATNCYNTGAVSGSSSVGGVSGSGSPANCYNTGTVSGSSSVGGVVGSGTATNSYYLDTENNGEKKTSAEFASGEVTWRLQNGQSDFVWGQTLNSDDFPLLVTFETSAKRVWKAAFIDEDNSTELAAEYLNNGDKITEPADVTKSGFTAEYYSTTGRTSKYTFGNAISDDVNIYVTWVKSSYIVTFEYQDGSTSPTTKEYDPDTAYGSTLPNPTRTGYTFGGWFKDSGCTGSAVTSTDTVSDNHTLYAKWTANTYTITYKDMGGADFSGEHESGNPTTHTYDTATSLKGATKTGYNFGGWYKEIDCTGIAITSIGATDFTDDITLYAKWSTETYDITYKTNGGTIADESNYTEYEYGQELTLPTPTKTGYRFDGWYEEIDFSGVPVTAISVTDTGDKTFYAKWTANTYTATFNANGGGWSGEQTQTIDQTYDSAWQLPSSDPTREGYAFGGWWTAVTGGTQVKSGDIYRIDGETILYAHWSAGSFKVTFDYNGADGGDSYGSKSVVFGDPYGSLPTPTKTGYSFGGWYTGTDGSGTKITSDKTVEITADTTLYAYWTECDHSNGRWGAWTYDADSHSHVCQDCGKTVTEEHKYSDWTKQDDTYHIRICECGRSDTAEHSWDKSKGTVTVQPTCTAMGTTTYPCADNCGAVHDEIDIDMIPHNFSGTWIENVSGDGHYRKCEVCGTPSDTVSHDWNEGTFTLGNCTTESKTDFVCNSCGAEKTEYGDIVSDVHAWQDSGYDEQGHHLRCQRCGETEISDHIWDEGTVDFEPTCVSKGQLTQHCTVSGCSETKTVDIDINPNSHKWSSEWQSDESGHWHICLNGCGVTNPVSHTWGNGVPTLEATCTTAGEETVTCTDCGYSKTETTNPKGHDFSGEWKSDVNGHWHECSRDGEKSEIIPHTEKEVITTPATSTTEGLKTYICDDCGYEIRTEVIPATGESGNITVDSESGANAPAVSMDASTTSRLEAEVYAEHTTPEERAAIDNGSNLDVILRVEDAGDTVPVSDKQATEAVIAGANYTLGQYLNIDMLKFIDGQEAGKITRLSSPISVTIEVPENMRNANRAFVIVRIHEGKADMLRDIDNDPNTITIMTDRFSTYAIAYQDGQQGGVSGGQNSGTVTPVNPWYPSSVPTNNSSSDSNDKSVDSNSNTDDVSSAAGLYGENDLLADGDTATVADMFIPTGMVLAAMAFIIRKRSKASK